MRILWMASVCPVPATDGNRLRHYGLLRELAGRHEVTLVAPVSAAERRAARALDELCRFVPVAERRHAETGAPIVPRVRSLLSGNPHCFVPACLPEMAQAARQLSYEYAFDAVVASLYVAPAAAMARARVLIVDDQNVESQLYRDLWQAEPNRLRRVARRLDSFEVAKFEHRWLRRANGITVCSEQDLVLLQDTYRALPPIWVVPNGVDIPDKPLRELGADVAFIASFGYFPNAHAARFLVEQVMPAVWHQLPETRLWLVGKDPPEELRRLSSPRVQVTGLVDSVREYMARAAVVVTPMLVGGGTRLKVLEALAAGVPVVATKVAAEGLSLIDDCHAVIREEPTEIAQAVVDLLQNPERANSIGLAGRQFVMRHFSWSKVSTRLEDALEVLLPEAQLE